MRVAVMSLTRDRLDYTKHCFSRLRELAGCDYDHFVFDNGSQDGTPDWLRNEYAPTWLETSEDNRGVSVAINSLLDRIDGYDVIVKFDNDCSPVTQNCLVDSARFVMENPKWVISPRILGLNDPPVYAREETISGQRVGPTGLIGGIFLVADKSMYDGYRHDPKNPLWGMDDVQICERAKRMGGNAGYLIDHAAYHYETTEGQKLMYPDYWSRKYEEFYGKPLDRG